MEINILKKFLIVSDIKYFRIEMYLLNNNSLECICIILRSKHDKMYKFNDVEYKQLTRIRHLLSHLKIGFIQTSEK